MSEIQPKSGAAVFARNVLWNWLGVAVALAGGFVIAPYMIRKLGDEGYGLWALVFAMVEYFGLLDMGFRSATVKYCAHHRALGEKEKVNEVVNTSLLYFLAIAVVVIGLTLSLAPFAGRFVVVSPASARTFYWLVLLTGCNAGVSMIGQVFQAGLEGLSRFDIVGRTTILTSAIRMAGMFALLSADSSLLVLGTFAVSTYLLAHLLNGLQFKMVFPDFRISRRLVRRSVLGKLARYGVHTATAGAGTQLLYQTPPLLIGHFRSAAAVGYYNVPVRLMQSTGIEITARVAVVSSSRAAELCARRDFEGIGRLGVFTNRYCLALFMPLAIFLAVYGRDFLKVWIGPAFALASAPLLLPFVIGTALAVCAQFNTSSILYGMAEHRLYARGLLVEGLLSAAALVFVVPAFGILGAAWTAAILMIANRGLWSPWVLCRAIRWNWLRFLGSILIRPLLTAVPVFAIAWLAHQRLLAGRNWFQLVSAGICIAGLYGLTSILTCIEREHRQFAWKGVLSRLGRRPRSAVR